MLSSSILTIILLLAVNIVILKADQDKQLFKLDLLTSKFNQLVKDFGDSDLDIWDVSPTGASSVRVSVYTDMKNAQQIRRKYIGSSFRTVLDVYDVNEKARKEKQINEACRTRTMKSFVTNADDFFQCYRPSAETFAFLNKLTASNPKYMETFTISQTYEGKNIPGYKISNGDGKDKKAIFLQGQLHAREWIVTPSIAYVMNAFIQGINSNDLDIKNLVQKYDWYFAPLVNIDGYEYSWSSSRYWRKNRRGGFGVDLNRNYPHQSFCTSGASKYKGSQTYCGTAPFSEPEIKGIDTWMKTKPSIFAALDVHSYGHWILRPYGYKNAELPGKDGKYIQKLGIEMRDRINKVDSSSKRFTSIVSASTYPTTGSSEDFFYMSRGMLTYTLELRGNDFAISAGNIVKSGEEVLQGMKAFSNAGEWRNYD